MLSILKYGDKLKTTLGITKEKLKLAKLRKIRIFDKIIINTSLKNEVNIETSERVKAKIITQNLEIPKYIHNKTTP